MGIAQSLDDSTLAIICYACLLVTLVVMIVSPICFCKTYRRKGFTLNWLQDLESYWMKMNRFWKPLT